MFSKIQLRTCQFSNRKNQISETKPKKLILLIRNKKMLSSNQIRWKYKKKFFRALYSSYWCVKYNLVRLHAYRARFWRILLSLVFPFSWIWITRLVCLKPNSISFRKSKPLWIGQPQKISNSFLIYNVIWIEQEVKLSSIKIWLEKFHVDD